MMRRVAVAMFILALVALALVPWAVVELRSRPLLPDDLLLARQYYESTVEAAQDGTIAAIRRATSVPTIRIIGDVYKRQVFFLVISEILSADFADYADLGEGSSAD